MAISFIIIDIINVVRHTNKHMTSKIIIPCTYSPKPFPVNNGTCIDDILGVGSADVTWEQQNCCYRTGIGKTKRCYTHKNKDPESYLELISKDPTDTAPKDELCYDIILKILDFVDIYSAINFASTYANVKAIFMEHYGVVPSGTCNSSYDSMRDEICKTHTCRLANEVGARCCKKRVVDLTKKMLCTAFVSTNRV